MKNLIVFYLILLGVWGGVNAQTPPVPYDGNDNKTPNSAYHLGRPRKSPAPIGTATLLLLTLGGATLGYKVVKNSKQEKEDK